MGNTIIRQAPFLPPAGGKAHSFTFPDANPFGAPVERELRLPWELYSVTLLLSDALLMGAVLLFLLGGAPRLPSVSISLRCSNAFVYGAARISMIDYLFSGTGSVYYFLATALFGLVFAWAGSALLAGAGPLAAARPKGNLRGVWRPLAFIRACAARSADVPVAGAVFGAAAGAAHAAWRHARFLVRYPLQLLFGPPTLRRVPEGSWLLRRRRGSASSDGGNGSDGGSDDGGSDDGEGDSSDGSADDGDAPDMLEPCSFTPPRDGFSPAPAAAGTPSMRVWRVHRGAADK